MPQTRLIKAMEIRQDTNKTRLPAVAKWFAVVCDLPCANSLYINTRSKDLPTTIPGSGIRFCHVFHGWRWIGNLWSILSDTKFYVKREQHTASSSLRRKRRWCLQLYDCAAWCQLSISFLFGDAIEYSYRSYSWQGRLFLVSSSRIYPVCWIQQEEILARTNIALSNSNVLSAHFQSSEWRSLTIFF